MPRTFAAIAVLALIGAVAAQGRPRPGHSGADYLPLVPGTTWRYARTDAAGASVAVDVECRGDALVGMQRCSELEVRIDGRTSSEYWSADRDGVWQHCPGGSSTASAPRRLLFGPVGVQWRWEWDGATTFEGIVPRWVEGVSEEGIPPVGRHRAVITDLGASVSVPAGTFSAVRVTVDVDGDGDGASEGLRTVLWFAKGVGVVRREQYRLQGTQATLACRDELVAFAAAPAGPSALANAHAFIAARADLWPQGAPAAALVALPLGATAAATQFVRTGAAQGPPFVRVTRGEAVAFDPTRVEDVAALLAADAPPQGPRIETRRLDTFARRYLGLRHAAADGTVPAIAVQLARSGTHLENGRLLQRALFVSDHGLLELCLRGGRLEWFAYAAR